MKIGISLRLAYDNKDKALNQSTNQQWEKTENGQNENKNEKGGEEALVRALSTSWHTHASLPRVSMPGWHALRAAQGVSQGSFTLTTRTTIVSHMPRCQAQQSIQIDGSRVPCVLLQSPGDQHGLVFRSWRRARAAPMYDRVSTWCPLWPGSAWGCSVLELPASKSTTYFSSYRGHFSASGA